jgi:uncharacterized repeat protein (TIGR01451 family)
MKNYFKKFSIMFVMTLAIMLGSFTNALAVDTPEIGTANLNGTSQNSAKIRDQLLHPEIGWKRYDDDNMNIEYSKSFFKMSNQSCYNGYLHQAYWNNPDNFAKFNFYGSKIRIIGWMASNHIKLAEISFDGGETFESCSQYGTNSPYQSVTYEKTGLEKKIHNVVIKIPQCDPSGGYYFRFDAIDIDNDGYLAPYSGTFNNESISLDKSSMDLTVGETQQLTATTTPAAIGATWTSSDNSIATVDNTGNVTGISAGQATITATTADGSNLSASCTVNVGNQTIPTTGITLNKTTDSMVVGQTDNLIATVTPDNAVNKNVTWSSSDPSIATVDSNGKVTAIKEGTVTMTATTADGLTATCAVTVTPKGIEPNPAPTESEYIINTARAKGDNTNNASGEVSIIFKGVAEAQLSVVKTADVQSVYVGDTFTYTIVVTNTSSKIAKAVVVNDNAPNHIQFTVSGVTTTQGKVDPSSTSKNIIVNVGDIPPLGIVTIKIPATVIL